MKTKNKNFLLLILLLLLSGMLRRPGGELAEKGRALRRKPGRVRREITAAIAFFLSLGRDPGYSGTGSTRLVNAGRLRDSNTELQFSAGLFMR